MGLLKLIKKNNADFVYSPFRYNGHQSYALGNLLSTLPNHTVYIDPFCGGGGLFFAKRKVKLSWLNDIDKELIITYEVMRDNPEKLFQFFSSIKKEEYYYIRDGFKPNSREDIAARWFF